MSSNDETKSCSRDKDRMKSLKLLLIGIVGFLGFYSPVNWLNSLRSSHFEFYFDWELQIPVVPSFILIYFSAYLLPFIPFFKQNLKEQEFILKSLLICGFIGAVIFLLLPTQLGYEREIDNIAYFKPLFLILWKLDYPHNLMPSLHVVMSYILIVPGLSKTNNLVVKSIFITWLILICLSIVFVHQHHIIDIFTGLILSHCVYKFYYLKRINSLNNMELLSIKNEDSIDRAS